jgi:GntR family transcriptional regulator, uxu operon transcriptional repressor
MAGQPAAGPSDPVALHSGSQAPDRHAEGSLKLAELIIAHSLRLGLGAGGRMPTERQLATDLGVTRSSVRYALGLMEAQGYISREVGRGTYLRSPAGPLDGEAPAGPIDALLARVAVTAGVPAARPAGDAGARAAARATASAPSAFAPADVMMVRRLLEPPAMPLAVAWATAADFEEMDRCLAGGDRAGTYEEFETWDLALHRSIMAATHSPLLRTLYAAIEAARHGHIWGDLKRRSASAERRRQYQADHHQIVAALKARDSGAAVKAMRAHLARVSDHLNATDPAAAIWQ